MRLLFDQNLSVRLVERLSDVFPRSSHVRLAGLEASDDQAVWAYAGASGLILVSKDGDFYHMSTMFGPPPRVIWLNVGNCSTDCAEACLRNHLEAIRLFNGSTGGILIIGRMQSRSGAD